jgi:hypothetical protein
MEVRKIHAGLSGFRMHNREHVFLLLKTLIVTKIQTEMFILERTGCTQAL